MRLSSRKRQIAGGGFLRVREASLISIGVSDKIVQTRMRQLQTKTHDAFDVLQNPLEKLEIQLAWITHMQINLLHSIGDIRASEGELLKSTSEAAVEGQIGHMSADGSR